MQLPTRNPDVIFRRVTDGAVLLSTADEVYFGLNEVGAFIWEQLDSGLSTRAELRDVLAEKYPEVDVNTVEADMNEVLAELIRAGLLSDGADQEESAG